MNETRELEDYKYPVWGTQGGGLARRVGGIYYVFVKAPDDCPELGVGDEVPDLWDLAPANNLARLEEDRDQFGV